MNIDFLDKVNDIIFKTGRSTDEFNKLDLILLMKNAKCNFSCSYCFINNCKNIPLESKNLIDINSLQNAFQIIKNKENPILTIWAGEPLFNKEGFTTLCSAIHEKVPQARIIINTNGSLLDDWWADFFKEYKVYINISHDGLGQKYRGFDFLESESHIKAIRKIQEYGNLNNFKTVIHKNNCSFNGLYEYFTAVKDQLGIAPKNYDYVFVMPDLTGNIPHNFSHMDKDLIKFVYDNITFLLARGIKENYNAIYPGMHNEILNILKRMINNCTFKLCSPEAPMINTLGQPICTRSFFNGDEDKNIRANHIKKCTLCENNTLCPLANCQAIKVADYTCEQIKNEILTIKDTLNNIMVDYETICKN